MAKSQKNPTQVMLPKNIGAIHISNDLTIVERKIMNIILWNALRAEQKQVIIQNNADNKKYYKITLSEIIEYIGWDSSNNISHIKSALEKLVSTTLRFNILAKQNTDNGKWNVVTNLLGAVIYQDNGQEIHYCFNDVIKDIVIKPTLYGMLDFSIQQNITSKYTLALWEYLTSELSISQTKKCTTEYLTIKEYVELIAGRNVKYEEFKYINKEFIKEPLIELMQKTNIHVTHEFKKNGRKVENLRFITTLHNVELQNTDMQPHPNKNHDNQQNNDIYNMCKNVGISEVYCNKYSKLHTLGYIKSNIEYIKKIYQNRKTPALYRKAIEDNYANYGFDTKQQQQSLDLKANKSTEYLKSVKSAEPEFEEHLKRTLMEYFSPLHHDWIHCLNIQYHTKGMIVISLLNTQQINAIERNKKKFDDVFQREYQNTFNREVDYKFISFIP
jgi:hypothetical protein